MRWMFTPATVFVTLCPVLILLVGAIFVNKYLYLRVRRPAGDWQAAHFVSGDGGEMNACARRRSGSREWLLDVRRQK